MFAHFASRFAIRWLVSGLGLFVCAGLLGPERLSIGGSWTTVAAAGFLLALVNMALKPILIVLSFPAIILSLGLFMLVVNGFLVMLVGWLYEPLFVANFGVAVVAGIIIGLVNYLVSRILEDL
jgi:putative membrane protein